MWAVHKALRRDEASAWKQNLQEQCRRMSLVSCTFIDPLCISRKEAYKNYPNTVRGMNVWERRKL